MLNVAGHACLQDWARLAQLAKQASVAASANRSLRSFTTEPAVAGPNSDRSKAALTRNFIEKSPCLSLVIVISPSALPCCSPLSAPRNGPAWPKLIYARAGSSGRAGLNHAAEQNIPLGRRCRYRTVKIRHKTKSRPQAASQFNPDDGSDGH